MSSSIHTAKLALLNDHTRLPPGAQVLITMAVMVTKWDRHRRTRKALDGLEQHLLEDVGLTPEAAYNEARKSFWKD